MAPKYCNVISGVRLKQRAVPPSLTRDQAPRSGHGHQPGRGAQHRVRLRLPLVASSRGAPHATAPHCSVATTPPGCPRSPRPPPPGSAPDGAGARSPLSAGAQEAGWLPSWTKGFPDLPAPSRSSRLAPCLPPCPSRGPPRPVARPPGPPSVLGHLGTSPVMRVGTRIYELVQAPACPRMEVFPGRLPPPPGTPSGLPRRRPNRVHVRLWTQEAHVALWPGLWL